MIFILCILSYIIQCFLYYKLLEQLHPVHTIACYKFSSFLFELILDEWEFQNVIANIICITSCLIYLEILELNFCGFNTNIRKIFRKEE